MSSPLATQDRRTPAASSAWERPAGAAGGWVSSGAAARSIATLAAPAPAESVVTLTWPSLNVSPGWSGASRIDPPGWVSISRDFVVSDGSSSTRMLTPAHDEVAEREVVEGPALRANLQVVPVVHRAIGGVAARDPQRRRLGRRREGGVDRVGPGRADRLDVGRLEQAEPLQVPAMAVAPAVRAHHVEGVVVLAERAVRGDRHRLAARSCAGPAARVVEPEVVAQLVAGHANAQVAVDPRLGARHVGEPCPAAARLFREHVHHVLVPRSAEPARGGQELGVPGPAR